MREKTKPAGASYYRARYYDPQAGRLLKEDPIRFAAGTDFYSYVGNSPTNFLDPFGLCPPSRNQRLALAAEGLLNIGIGIGKTAGGITLTAGSSGLGVGFGGYLIVSGIVANVGGGLSQIIGAATGNVEGGEQGGNAMAAAGTAVGFLTWTGTGGNVCKAAKAAKYEGAGLAPFMAGLGVESTAVDAVSGAGDSALNGAEIVTDKNPCAPTPPKPSACSQNENCPQ
jgi:RHS repeat-associated protein